MNKYLFLFLLASISLFSCGKEEAIVEETVMVPFVGDWSGTYSGDDNGTLTMKVESDGDFLMTTRSSTGGGRSFGGKVTVDGTLSGINVDNSIEFTGRLQTTRGSGDYMANGGIDFNGSWVVEKDK